MPHFGGLQKLHSSRAMDLDMLVAISQLLAAVGVIASLVFLAIQLRQNTKAIRASSIQNLVQSLSAVAQTLVENESLVSIALRANNNPEQLTDVERATLHFWFVMAIRRFEGVYFQRSLGLVDNAFIEGFERSNFSIIASKSGRDWWNGAKEIFNSGFVSYVDEQLANGDPKSLHPAFSEVGTRKNADNQRRSSNSPQAGE